MNLEEMKGEFCRISDAVLKPNINGSIRSRFVTKDGDRPAIPDYPYVVSDVLAVQEDSEVGQVCSDQGNHYFMSYSVLFGYSIYGGDALLLAIKLRKSFESDTVRQSFRTAFKGKPFSASIVDTGQIVSSPTKLLSGAPLEVANFEVIVSVTDQYIEENEKEMERITFDHFGIDINLKEK